MHDWIRVRLLQHVSSLDRAIVFCQQTIVPVIAIIIATTVMKTFRCLILFFISPNVTAHQRREATYGAAGCSPHSCSVLIRPADFPDLRLAGQDLLQCCNDSADVSRGIDLLEETFSDSGL